jgi:hypothetical protein
MLFSNIHCNTLNHSTFSDSHSLCKSTLNGKYFPVSLNTVEAIELFTLIYLYTILTDKTYVQLCVQAVSVTHITLGSVRGQIAAFWENKKVNVYLPSLMMKVPDHLYVLDDTYTCHMLIKYNLYT